MSEQTQNPQNNASTEEANNVTTQDVTQQQTSTKENNVETTKKEDQPKDYVQKVVKNFAGNNPERAKEMVSNKKNIPLKLLYVEEDNKCYIVKQR